MNMKISIYKYSYVLGLEHDQPIDQVGTPWTPVYTEELRAEATCWAPRGIKNPQGALSYQDLLSSLRDATHGKQVANTMLGIYTGRLLATGIPTKGIKSCVHPHTTLT